MNKYLMFLTEQTISDCAQISVMACLRTMWSTIFSYWYPTLICSVCVSLCIEILFYIYNGYWIFLIFFCCCKIKQRPIDTVVQKSNCVGISVKVGYRTALSWIIIIMLILNLFTDLNIVWIMNHRFRNSKSSWLFPSKMEPMFD